MAESNAPHNTMGAATTQPRGPHSWEPTELDRATEQKQDDMRHHRRAASYTTYFQGIVAYLQTPSMANNVAYELRAAIGHKRQLRSYRTMTPEETAQFVTEAIAGLPKAWFLRQSSLDVNVSQLVACQTTLNQLRPALQRLRKELPRGRWAYTRWGAMNQAYYWLNAG